MQFTLSSGEGLQRRIEVAIPHTRVAGQVDRKLRELSRTASLRGFRPGKVPLLVIKKQFGAQVHGDTVSELIRETFAEAVDKEKLRPAGGPRIEPISLEPGNDLKYAAVFEVMPEVTVKPVAELAVERPTVDVGDADIDAMIESMRRQRLEYREVDRAARISDRVTVDFLGRLDGTPFAGGEGKDTPFVLGSGRAIADFEAALTGMKAGESRTVPVGFPENYAATELAGKTTEFDLAVKKVEEEVLPEVDDAFALAFGLNEGGVSKLRDEVRNSMEREAGEAIRNRVKTQVFDALARENPVALPTALVDEQVQELQIDLLRRSGREPKDVNDLPPREPFVEPARRRVLLGLLVGELVRRENLQVDRERVLARLNEIAGAYPNADEVRRAYLQNPDALRQIETAVLEDQVVDWVVRQAKVTDRPISFAELTGFNRQGQNSGA
jgi:trigger factor